MTTLPIEAATLPSAKTKHTAEGLIGPNAITRLAEAVHALQGEKACHALFSAAGLDHHLKSPPNEMVDENDVAQLHAALHRHYDFLTAARITSEAGTRTGDYLLAHRIPNAAQKLLKCLPRKFAARILTGAIARHAWTFAGSGQFTHHFSPEFKLTLTNAPVAKHLCTACPACHYYAATFERVFSAMLGPQTRVSEITCQACGDDTCQFLVSY